MSSHGLPLFAESFDAETNDIACTQVSRRLESKAHAGRCAGRNDVSRLQAHGLREIGNQLRNLKNHLVAVAVLNSNAVDFEPHSKRMRIADLIRGNQPRPNGPKAIAPF